MMKMPDQKHFARLAVTGTVDLDCSTQLAQRRLCERASAARAKIIGFRDPLERDGFIVRSRERDKRCKSALISGLTQPGWHARCKTVNPGGRFTGLAGISPPRRESGLALTAIHRGDTSAGAA